ncbi:DMT family transporter [Paenibacillus sp. NPDC056722]|uniref:DMT family transporter n=1 Tax=Paenibacillus sp. NPDC056722 TaxID=3345924 RepID=UPI0036BF3204
MNSRHRTAAHIATLVTILFWGTTFISSKVLLSDFSPMEILFTRFLIGYVALWIVHPRLIPFQKRAEELLFAAAGLCGVTLYFLLENIALTYTYASNVGVIVTVAPFFTAVAAHFILKDEKLHFRFFVGFLIAMIGIALISWSGSSKLQLNPLGDLLAVLACISWALYSILLRKINQFQYPSIGMTRRVFFYGLIFMLPVTLISDFRLDLARFGTGSHLWNFLFLGLGASALCYVSWNWSVGILGAIKTSVYFYLTPVVTVIAAYLLLHERITGVGIVGIALTLVGLIVSEQRFLRKRRHVTDSVTEQGKL